MTMFRNNYDCPCGASWTDDWSCMCDDRCPTCNTSCSPTSSVELVAIDSLQVVVDYAKMEAKIMATILETYGQSQKSNQGTITGRMTSRIPSMSEIEKHIRGISKDQHFHGLYGKFGRVVIDDMIQFPQKIVPEEGLPYDPGDFYEDADRLVYGTFRFPSTEKDWERTRFVAGGETPPDAKKRAQLKAKRKKR